MKFVRHLIPSSRIDTRHYTSLDSTVIGSVVYLSIWTIKERRIDANERKQISEKVVPGRE